MTAPLLTAAPPARPAPTARIAPATPAAPAAPATGTTTTMPTLGADPDSPRAPAAPSALPAAPPATPAPQAAELFVMRTESPIGRIEVTADDEALLGLSIEGAGSLPHDASPEHPNAVTTEAVRQLGEYFAGTRREFDLPVRLVGTPFQLAVWQQLQRLGWGDFVSYGELGRAAGRPGSGRAVGGAVGANPIPLIVGCHRVLASNQKITGYSGGNGIPTKVWLLDHESIGHL